MDWSIVSFEMLITGLKTFILVSCVCVIQLDDINVDLSVGAPCDEIVPSTALLCP